MSKMGVVKRLGNPVTYGTLLLLLFILPSVLWAQSVNFTNVTDNLKVPGWTVLENGFKVSCYGHGISWGDVSNDSIPDLFISSAVRKANGRIPETLYIGHPGGTAFSEEDGKRGVSDSYGMTGTHGISLFDYDNDGDLDIYNATTDDRNRLYRNDGTGFFADVSDAAHLFANKVWVDTYGEIGYGTRGVVAFDANNDGHMDLLGVNWGPVENKAEIPWVTPPQPNEFYRNNGDGTFAKQDDTGLTHPENPSNIGTQGVTAADVNNDGWMDVFICHRNYAYLGKDAEGKDLFGPGPKPAPNQLLINDGTGHFKDETVERGLYDAQNDCNGATFADFDNDGDLDAFVVPKSMDKRYLAIYENDGRGYFTNISSQVKVQLWGFSAVLGDLNNDGWLDIFGAVSYGQTSLVHLNNGQKNFVQQSNIGIEYRSYDPRGAGLADYDLDGDLDIYYVDANKDKDPRYSNRLFRNDLSKTNNWLKVTGRGPKGDGGGFGTKIWLFESGHMDDMNYLIGYRQVMNTYGYLCQDDPVQHFGLGARTRVDVKVRLLDGTELKMADVASKRKVIFTRPNQLIKLGGDNQRGPAGAPLPQPLRVKVVNAQGQPVRGAQVRFANKIGHGSFQPADSIFTGSDGIASIGYVVGPVVQTQEIIATSPDLPGEMLFTVTNTSPASAKLTRISSTNLTGSAGQLLPSLLEVKITDIAGNALDHVPVIFKVISGGGKVAEADSVIVLSDVQGVASASWRLGTQPGTAQQVKAYLSFSSNEYVLFDGVTYGLANQMVWQSLTNYNAVVGKALPESLTAKIIDAAGLPVSNYPVTFTIVAGNGVVNGSNQVQVLSNSEGLARCQWRMGPVAGILNQLRVAAGALNGSPVDVMATTSAGPAFRLAKVSGDGQSNPALGSFVNSLIVMVTDTFANPVANQPVRFEVVQGSATINNAAVVTLQTNATGQTGVSMKAGPVPGPVSIKVSSPGNGADLADSPQYFNAMVEPLPLDTAKGTIAASSPCVANGREESTITVQARDAINAAVSGVPVQFHATGSNNTFRPATVVTDAQGRATTRLISTRAEKKKIYAEVNGQPVSSDSAEVVFLAGPAASLAIIDGDGQTGFTGRMLPFPLRVALTDTFENPIAGAPLSVIMQTPDGRRIDLERQVTNGAGLIEYRCFLSQHPGQHHYIVGYGTLSAVTFTAEAQNIIPAFLEKISGEGQVGLGNSVLANPLVVRVVDKEGAAVAGIAVTFSFSTGSGIFPEGATVATGTDGKAAVLVQLGEQIGDYYIDAAVAGLADKVSFLATVRPPRPSRLEIISGDAQSARAGEFLPQPLIVRVIDELLQPVDRAQVRFIPIAGGGAVVPSVPVMTGGDGAASVSWALGSEDIQRLRAEVVDQTHVQAFFSANLHSNYAPLLFCTSDTTLSENQPLSFSVFATDQDNDPITLSALELPDGAAFDSLSGLFAWTPTYEQAGLYRITFKAVDGHGGESIRVCRIMVTNVAQPILILSHFPADTVVSLEMYKPVLFQVEARDPDGDSLRYQWYFNNLSVGTLPALQVIPNPTFPEKSQVSVRVYSSQSSILLRWMLNIMMTNVSIQQNGPERCMLGQNYPNPFNPSTHIPFQMAAAGEVRLSLFNQAGQMVRILTDGMVSAGWHEVIWDGCDMNGAQVPSGTYYCRMETNSFQEIKKLLLLK